MDSWFTFLQVKTLAAGFTLARAWQQQGGQASSLLEIDIKRGSQHDLSNDVGPYAAVTRAALENKLHAIVGGPNCRSRSVLQHYKVPGQPNCTRPIRAWGGGEYGIDGLAEAEQAMIQEDDLLLWRMLFVAMVSIYIKEARKDPRSVVFTLGAAGLTERLYARKCVLLGHQRMGIFEGGVWLGRTAFAQGQLGGSATKPATFGGNLELEVNKHKRVKKAGEAVELSPERIFQDGPLE